MKPQLTLSLLLSQKNYNSFTNAQLHAPNYIMHDRQDLSISNGYMPHIEERNSEINSDSFSRNVYVVD